MNKDTLKGLIKELWDKSKLNEEGVQETKIMLGGKPYKLALDVNKNPTKKGIKVQFLSLDGNPEPSSTPQKDLQIEILNQLNKGLKKYGLEGDIDPDVPDKKIIGFYIRLQYFDKIIRNALRGGTNEKESTTSTETPADSIEDQQ
jgi:hypothetical protein